MSRKHNKLPVLTNLEIIDVADEGKSVARYDEMVVFVSHAVPGDIVDVQVTHRSKNFREGYPVFFHKYSEKRVSAFCSHFGICGGCKWQDLAYQDQLFYKQKTVSDCLHRIAKVELPEMNPILPSENTQYYRNKLEFTFSNRRWLTKEEMPDNGTAAAKNMYGIGFHIPGMFDKVLDIDKCYLQGGPSNRVRLAIRAYALENGFSFFDLRKQEGLLRNLIIRTTSSGEVMVQVVFFYDDPEKRAMLLDFISNSFPEISSLYYFINKKRNDSTGDIEPVLYKGDAVITEEMEGLKFKIGPKSFFQTNSSQALRLYRITKEFAALSGSEVVYDLFTGTGTIANFVAGNAKKVIGIEYIPEAVEDAKENSKLNGISNTSFFAGDIKDILNTSFFALHGKPGVIILDPPRAGVHQNVIDAILFAQPFRIVYVSCNPATQARDIALLDPVYRVTAIQPVDMFPHTHHVENVMKLEKK